MTGYIVLIAIIIVLGSLLFYFMTKAEKTDAQVMAEIKKNNIKKTKKQIAQAIKKGAGNGKKSGFNPFNVANGGKG